MIADPQLLEKIIVQIRELSPEYRLHLVQRIIQTLLPPTAPLQSRPIRFGEYSGDEASMSTLKDFAVAEWRPTDGELDGP